MSDYSRLQPIQEVNLNHEIRGRLKNFIIQNNLKPGDKLPTEEMLAEQLGVSRTAVREALRSLEALGIIEARQGYGRVVCDFNFHAILNNLSYGFAFQNHNIVQVTEIRKALDAYFIKVVIDKLTADDLGVLSTIVERMYKKTAQGLDIAQEDQDFHALLFTRADNPLALQLFEIHWAVRMNAYNQPPLSELLLKTAPEHAALLTAIQQRDVSEARRLILAHHHNTERLFRAQIASNAASEADASG